MTPEATFEQSPDWLVVRARGAGDTAGLKDLLGRIAAAAREAPSGAVLADIREVTATLTLVDRYDIGVFAAALRFPGPLAVIAAEQVLDPQRFAELVARNRGANVRGFTDPEAARRWLREQMALRLRGGAQRT